MGARAWFVTEAKADQIGHDQAKPLPLQAHRHFSIKKAPGGIAVHHQHGPAATGFHDMHVQPVAYGDAITGKRDFLRDPSGKIGRWQLLHPRRLPLPTQRGKSQPSNDAVAPQSTAVALHFRTTKTPIVAMATAAAMRAGHSWSHGHAATGCFSSQAATRTPIKVVIRGGTGRAKRGIRRAPIGWWAWCKR